MKIEIPLAPVEKEGLRELIYKDLQLKTNVSREFIEELLKLAVLFDKKQQDYGARNISAFGLFGVAVRMNDKMSRLVNLMGKKKKKPVNESLRDSFRDISVYGIIALLVGDGRWPKE